MKVLEIMASNSHDNVRINVADLMGSSVISTLVSERVEISPFTT
jgi:hypothetical protein